MKNKNKIVIAFVIGALVGMPLSGAVYAMVEKAINVMSGVHIQIDGKDFVPKDASGKEVEVFVYNGTTYLPLRAISEEFGKEIVWDGSTKTVKIGKMPEKKVNEKYLGEKGMEYMHSQNEYGNAKYAYGLADINKAHEYHDNTGNGYYNYLVLDCLNEKNRCFKNPVNPYSYVQIDFPSNAKYSRFKASLAVWNKYKDFTGDVKFNVLADDKVIFEKIMKAGDMPEDLDLDVSGALKVSFKLIANTGSTDWLDDNKSGIGLFDPRFVE